MSAAPVAAAPPPPPEVDISEAGEASAQTGSAGSAGSASKSPWTGGAAVPMIEDPSGQIAPTTRRQHEWNSRTPEDAELMHVLRATQEEWINDHPDPKLLLPKHFPTTRREALKIPFRMMSRAEKLHSSAYSNAIDAVLTRFPESIKRTVSYVFLNYLSPYQAMIQQQGRHLFMIKAIEGRSESHCWFIPLSELQSLHSASSENLRQGISYNDLALVQTYSVLSVLAVHGERWESRTGQGAQAYGECTWIGGMAFHYARGDAVREASMQFAMVPTDQMPELAAKTAKAREKRQRQKANRASKRAEEDDRRKEEERQRAEQEDATRRAGLIKVHESLAEALAKGTLIDHSDSSNT